jgi:hypothetical protein
MPEQRCNGGLEFDFGGEFQSCSLWKFFLRIAQIRVMRGYIVIIVIMIMAKVAMMDALLHE